MENNETKKVMINNLIALCHIIDNYDEFNKNLFNLFSEKHNIHNINDNLYKLYEISQHKIVIGERVLKKFYQKNKNVIDIINKYSSIWLFISIDYDSKRGLVDYSDLNFFYQYILDNKKKLGTILSILNRLKNLGFTILEFDEDSNFINDEYEINTVFRSNCNIEYVDNIEIIPNYQSDIVEYKTSQSNYKMSLHPHSTLECEKFQKRKIIVNSLLFDENRLPKTLTKESTFDKIINLWNDKKKECSIIRNSVNLSMNIESLISSFISTDNLISKLDDIENKNELLEILIKIQTNLEKLKNVSSSYDNSLSKKYSIPQETFEKEKQKYLERSYYSSIDID